MQLQNRIGSFWCLTKDIDFKTLFWLFSLNQLTVANFKLELCCSLSGFQCSYDTFTISIVHIWSLTSLTNSECDFRLDPSVASVNSGFGTAVFTTVQL